MINPNHRAPAADQSQRQVALFDDGAMLRVPVNVFGRTLYFLVDTGFTFSAIDRQYTPWLGRNLASFQAENPLGQGCSLPVHPAPEISIAGQPCGLETITTLDLKMARLISGQPCDGILGMDFLAKNIVTLDFDHGTFSLGDEVPPKVDASFEAVPFRPFHQHFLVSVSVNRSKTLELMVDTGDNSSVSLNEAGWKAAFTRGQTPEMTATLAGAGNQVASSRIAVIEQLRVGSLDYLQLHATQIKNPNDVSHLGLGFFRRHAVVFDFPNQRMYLQPGAEFLSPDKEDMSGLHLLRTDGTTFVHSVDDHSPAFQQGIKPNDVILSINGQDARTLSLAATRKMLQSRDGDQVSLLVRQPAGGCGVEITLTLKQKI